MDLRRILVAQPAPRGQDRWPVSVGVLRWSAGEYHASVVVKAALSFGPDAPRVTEGRVAARWIDAPPLSLGRRDPLGAYPSDFVPLKGLSDVLLVGYARTPPRPSSAVLGSQTVIDGAFAFQDVSFRFRATGPGPGDRVPLSPEHLRGADGAPGFTVGPVRDRPLERDGRHGDAFDYVEYNAAPEWMRTSEIDSRGVLRMTGLTHEPTLDVVLPGLAPRVRVDWAGLRGPSEVQMDLDTLWVDTDGERIFLVWRGHFSLAKPDASDVDRLVVTIAPAPVDTRNPAGIQIYWNGIMRELPRGSFGWATEREDVEAGANPPSLAPDELDMARYDTWEHEQAPEPTLTLERYAAISAEIGEERESREGILERNRLDAYTWSLEERAWVEQMAEVVTAADQPSVAAEFGAAFVAAQDALARPEEERTTLAQYAALSVAMERRDPTKVLKEAHLTLPEWMRLDRRWTKRAQADKGVATELDRLVAAERAKPPPPDDDDDERGVGGSK